MIVQRNSSHGIQRAYTFKDMEEILTIVYTSQYVQFDISLALTYLFLLYLYKYMPLQSKGCFVICYNKNFHVSFS